MNHSGQNSTTLLLQLSPKNRWALQKIVLGRFVGFGDKMENDPLLLESLRKDGIKADQIEALINAEKKRMTEGAFAESGRLWPTPISRSIYDILFEDLQIGIRNAFRLIDLFEVLIKYVTTIAISDVVRGSNLSEGLQNILSSSLHAPYLGNWAGYCRVFTQELGIRQQEPFMVEIVQFYEKYLKRDIDALLSLRNYYAHGGTPPEDECLWDCIENLPRIFRLLQKAAFLTRYPLICSDGTKTFLAMGQNIQQYASDQPLPDGSVYVCNPAGKAWLEISPLLAYRKCRHIHREGTLCGQRKFLFYNDQRKKNCITYIDYQKSHHGRDPDALKLFQEVFPLPAWRFSRGQQNVAEIIEEKGKSFIGREKETQDISHWISRVRRGFFMVLGPPGIGKSALLASIARHKWENINVIVHFISRGDRPDPHMFLRNILSEFARIFGSKIVAGSREEMQYELERQLLVAKSHFQRTGEKLLMILDGLDEALCETNRASVGAAILDVLPRHVPEGVVMLMAARPRPEINDYYDALDREARRKMPLEGLTKENIRGLLYGPVSKYEIDSRYVTAVKEKSEGNPLYINLIVEEIFEGRLQANDTDRLPGKLEEIYEFILKRLGQKSESVIKVLLCLAYAREQLTIGQIAEINQLGIGRTMEIIDQCMEVLREDICISRNRTLSVFHESFAEFLIDHRDLSVEREKIQLQYLRYAIAREEQTAIPERVLLGLIRNKNIPKEDLPALSRLIESAGAMITSYAISVEALYSNQLMKSAGHIAELAHIFGPATSRVLTECLSTCLRQNPMAVEPFLFALLPGRYQTRQKINGPGIVQTSMICRDLAIAAISSKEVAKSAENVLYKLISHPDKRVRAIGVMGVFRASKTNYKSATAVIHRLSDEGITFGLPRPFLLEPFIGCILGLLFEHADNAEIRVELHAIVNRFASKIIFLKHLAWILPGVVFTFLSKIPSDYNPVNISELQAFKKELKKDKELAELARRMAEHCDPRHGSPQSFRDVMDASVFLLKKHKSASFFILIQIAVLNRTLTGDESALEESYQQWQLVKDLDGVCCQDFAYQLRIVQVARRLRNQPPLGQKWTDRAEEVMRHFFHKKGARFRNQHEYVGGSIIAALPFVVSQTGDEHPEILKEMIEHALMHQGPAAVSADNHRLDIVMLRILEVNAIEYGTYDQAARAVAFHGLRCFLAYPERLDEGDWQAIARIVSKMQTLYAREVKDLLGALPERIEQDIQRRIQKTVPDSKFGELISVRSEKFLGTLFSEPVNAEMPLRPTVMEMLFALSRPERLKTSFRRAIRVLFEAITNKDEIN